ncbi:MAG: response regulator transcription factor [Desulfuromonadaceae bacterium]|jgi:two-component system OmpR family response regulator|nr:response regulator transcription factor [Desulfuromonadaceae bacterium]MDD2733477.1 response regulator transcription factor [Desulfuromonadaceae bacterium]MDD5104353.1 response regulator transcription factor [Desulfuromonadaceae bacterium]MDD5104362.1 response regulator transcription factor [Desulfuromonadaceae bacterium]
MTGSILLVEDDIRIAEIAIAYLERAGFKVMHVANGRAAIERIATDPPSLVLLDLMLPDLSGEAICRELKEIADIPVVIVSSKASEEERLAGFALGADDYIVKPFSPRELVARVQAVLKRAGVSENGMRLSFNAGELIIDDRSHTVTCRGAAIRLTAVEFKILLVLAATPAKTFTREELVDKAMGYHFDGYERNIDSHIKNIRQKLGDSTKAPMFLITMYGLGYRFGGVRDV